MAQIKNPGAVANCPDLSGTRQIGFTFARVPARRPSRGELEPGTKSPASLPGLTPFQSAALVLFESGLNASKGCVQVCAEGLHDRDDRDRDAGGDEAVFDGSCGRLRYGPIGGRAFHLERPLSREPDIRH